MLHVGHLNITRLFLNPLNLASKRIIQSMATVDFVNCDRLIAWTEVRHLVPYSRPQIWRLEKQGLFPRRIRLGPGRVAWLLREISEWIEYKRLGLDWRIASEAGAANA